jgi:transcriptional regulator with XRE-family HTH domain
MTALELFGATVRTRRKALRLSLQALAEKTGLDRSYIGDIERGERNLSLYNILRLAVALDLPPSHLLRPFDTHPERHLSSSQEKPS